MSTIKLFFSITCFAIVYSHGLFKRHLLNITSVKGGHQTVNDQVARANLIKRAAQELGVKELTGNNDGLRIKQYLKYVHINYPAAWCAAFISFVYAEEGYSRPRSAWSPDLFPVARLTRKALPGDVLGIYFPEYKRIAHVGIVEKMDSDWCISLEGNTNVAGSRSGGGVYRRRRHIRTISKYANWINLGKGAP